MPPDYVPDYRHCLLPYVQWFQDDFLGGIRGMKAMEIGIYTVLLNEMYNRGVALDQPDERLARMCGTDTRTFRKVLEMLIEDEKIIRLDCGLWNARCENAFATRAKMQTQQSSAGKSSAEKRRKNKGGRQRPSNARVTAEQPISEAQNTEREEEYKYPSSPESDFEKFWPIYPKKADRKLAEKAFDKAKKRASVDTILAGAKVYAAQRAGQDPKYTKNASTWLNNDCWTEAVVGSAQPDWRDDPIYAGVE